MPEILEGKEETSITSKEDLESLVPGCAHLNRDDSAL